MKTLHIGVITIGFLISSSYVIPAFASVELDAYLPINGVPVTPDFKFHRTITLDYPDGGKLKEILSGKNFTTGFTEDSDKNPTVKSFMQQLNTELAKKTPVTITHLTVSYQVVVLGNDKQASFDYTITLKPTITGYVLNSGNDLTPTALDASWIEFSLKEPVVILSSYETEINYPENFIKNVFPDVYGVLYQTDAEKIFGRNMIDSNSLQNIPIDNWDSLFDPSYTLTDTAGSLSQGKQVPATTFSYGLSVMGMPHRI
ncbi:MAG: hypothetical protein ABI340_07985 [Nitrososphaera sp.]|jgi:hypothetical protein